MTQSCVKTVHVHCLRIDSCLHDFQLLATFGREGDIKKMVISEIILLVVDVESRQSSQWVSYESKSTENGQHLHSICSNDSTCPTWLICDAI